MHTWLFLLAAAQDADGIDSFEARIRPLLVEQCLGCHGEKKQKGGLRLDLKSGWEKGGDSGPALVPGKPDRSLLIRMIRGEPGKPPEMPPKGRLTDDKVADLVRWIERGAPDPRTGSAQTARSIDWAAAAEFWAFKPLKPVEGATVDSLVAAKLVEKGLKPVGRADRWTLIRRATFNLTGLPPTADEAAAFLADGDWAKVVDRLLASPAYGEHQARTWLDLARYAEDQAHVSEGKLGHGWRDPDWVIEAFNKDLPYERFVKLQIAADLIQEDPSELRALGFLGLGNIYARPNDLPLARAEQWDDRVDTLTRTFLGLTVSCARCHDHKFDPIPTQDYYSLAGIIASTKDVILPVAPREEVAVYDAAAARAAEAAGKAETFLQAETDRRALEKTETFAELALKSRSDPSLKTLDEYLRKGGGRSKRLEAWAATNDPAALQELAGVFQASVKETLAKPLKQRNLDQTKALFGEKGVFPLPEKTVVAAAAEDWKADFARLKDAAKAVAAQVPPDPARCHGVTEAEKPSDLKVYIRGNPHKTGEPAPRRFLRILAGTDAPRFTQGSGRRDLAEALVANPLSARVMVNRIWQQQFGRGLVATPSNFGVLGARPTHPELLDTLAARFTSVKRLHRELLLSETWQRASTTEAGHEAVDPENQWLWRGTRRRLRIEELRDALLAVSGALDRTPGGPSGDLESAEYLRRTVYAKISRMELSPLLRLFDFPDPNLSSERRTDTTLPQQSLFLMNSPFMLGRAKALAMLAAGENPEATVTRAMSLVFGRPPSKAEQSLGVRFLSATEEPGPSALTRPERYAQALLASNPFLFVD